MAASVTGRRGNLNSAKRVVTDTPPEWKAWRIKARHARAIKFIQKYLVPPKGYGAGKPMKLAPFQKGWLEEVLAPGVSSAAMELPRGNGKSTFLACVALWALFDEDDSGAPQVPIVATTLAQAIRSVYGVGLSMVKTEPQMFDRSLIYSGIGTQRIAVPYNQGELFPISNDPDGLQGLDPSVGVCDEIGFMPIESWDSLLLASGKRPQSLVVGIGTPGFDRENALWHLRERSTSGDVLPGFTFTEYAADEGCDLLDQKQWRQANPALEQGYMNIDALHTAAALSPESHFRIFRLGQWVEGVECWLGMDGRREWRALADPWAMEFGAETWAGIDVGLSRDTTAVTWVQKRDHRWHVKAKVWRPRPDGALDVTDAMQFIRELAVSYSLAAVAYDRRQFEFPAQQLLDEGYPMMEVPQSIERMSPAAGAALELIKRQEISHDGDEVLENHVLNAVARYNERGFLLSKQKSTGKIDACTAMVMALSEALALAGAEPFALWG